MVRIVNFKADGTGKICRVSAVRGNSLVKIAGIQAYDLNG